MTNLETLVSAHSNIAVTEEMASTIHASDPKPDGATLTIRPKSVELVQMVQAGGLDAWSGARSSERSPVHRTPEIDLGGRVR